MNRHVDPCALAAAAPIALLPVNLEVESALLGAILLNNDAFGKVAAFLTAEHFYEPLHQTIYHVIADLVGQGRVATPITVQQYLQADQVLSTSDQPVTTVRQYVARLASEAASVANAEDYGRVIRDLSARRQLITIAAEVEAAARHAEADVPIAALLEDAESRFAAVRETHHVGGLSLSLNGDVDQSMHAAADAFRRNEPAGWPWALPEVEQVVDGRMEPGNLYGCLGASGDGKTALSLQLLRFAAEHGVPVLFLSGEQTKNQCIWEMHAQRLSIRAKDIKDGRLSEKDWIRISDDAAALKKLPYAIHNWAESKVAQLAVRVRAFFRRWGPGIWAIDHVKKIAPDHRNDILAQQVFQVYEALKNVATSTGSVGLVLMQRNSEFLNRKVQRPIRGDVYGGEGGLQNLDACFAIYRPSKWLRERAKIEERQKERNELEDRAVQMDGKAELYCLKTRFGEEGIDRTVLFDAHYTRFSSPQAQRQAYEPRLGLD